MALITMVGIQEEGAYLPFPLPSGYLREGNKECDFALKKSHDGCVVSERERNMYDDSDFYAMIYDEKENKFEEIMFATTRGWSYPCLATCVDATPEIQEKWKKYCEIAAIKDAYLFEQWELTQPKVGRQIEVIKGRKVPKGTKWWIVSIEQSRYNKYVNRLGLRNDAGERTWTDSSNVKVI